mgnify:CR=1 FL=1
MIVVGIDPGMSGGVSVIDSTGEVSVQKYTTESEFIAFMESQPRESRVYIEDVPCFVSSVTSGASSFKLGYNYGFEVGVCRAFGFPVELVKPRAWQAGIPGLKPKMGYTFRKRLLKDVANRLFPQIKVTNAVADALLIMDYGCKHRPSS